MRTFTTPCRFFLSRGLNSVSDLLPFQAFLQLCPHLVVEVAITGVGLQLFSFMTQIEIICVVTIVIFSQHIYDSEQKD